jgi:hypothetical protein
MSYLRIQFNHGVEIGARLAYEGHFLRTGDERIKLIACEERGHQAELAAVLRGFGSKPTPFFDVPFTLIGNSVKFMCKWCPLWSLNLVARLLERFAVFSYNGLAVAYPEHCELFMHMSFTEAEHERYFSKE